MNLFVRFEKLLVEEDIIDDSGMGFVTPAGYKRNSTYSAPRFNQKNTTPGFSGFNRKMFSTSETSVSKRRCVNEEAKDDTAVNLDDVEFVMEAEKLEEELKGGRRVSEEGDVEGGVEGEEAVTVEDIDEIDISPRGYDKDFWSPLLQGDYGGSNAVNVIYNEDEIVDGMLRKSGPRYFSNSPNEPSRPSGAGVGSSGVAHEGSTNNERQEGVDGHVNGAPTARTRKLEDVADEEFDIPPLFNDTTYEASEIPDMDVAGDDGQIYVGKVYGNKEDCQISLSIYAIKKQLGSSKRQQKSTLSLSSVQILDVIGG